MGFGIARSGHLGKWRPYWNFAWPAFFSWRETPIEYLCQICCLYHNLNDSSDLCNYLLHYCVTIGLLPFVSRLSCWAWKHAGVYTCMHMASRTRIVAAVSKYGEHAWDYVIISWRHNLGATFLYFMFAKCSMFHERWRLCHFQNL